jgi:hypothetical protein
MRNVLLLSAVVVGCASSGTPLGEIGEFNSAEGGPPALDGAAGDAAVTPPAGNRDAAAVPDPSPGLGSCGLGSVSSAATSDQLDVFGNVVYYAKRQRLPAGRYRAEYTGGCFKLSFALKWTVQGGTANTDGWFLVSESTSEQIVKLPGTGLVGSQYAAGFDSFQECVDTNLSVPALEFEWTGGPLGVWLADFPYQDNVVGEGGQNPAWKLTLLTDCPPEIDLR